MVGQSQVLQENAFTTVGTAVADARMDLQVLEAHGHLDPRAESLIRRLLESLGEAEQRLMAQDTRIRHLESLSLTDELTGLMNRRGFDAELTRALARAQRHNETGVLLMCDLDRFKAINDTYGHPAGDAVLKAVGSLLDRTVRTSDAVARLGGDEFAALLIDAAVEAVSSRIADLREALSGLIVEYDGLRVVASASLGYTVYGPNSDKETVMALADKALYRVKSL